MSVVREIDVETLASRRKSGDSPFLLDVRQPGEFALARIEGALLIPLDELPSRQGELDASREIVVVCHHGVRSVSGAAILQNAGFERVVSLRGGIDAWSLRVDPAVPRY